MSGLQSGTYTDSLQVLPGYGPTGTALLGTDAGGLQNVTLTGISIDGTNFTPVAADSTASVNGFTDAGTVVGNYISFAVDADGSILLTENPDDQTLINDINANTSGVPLSDILYYTVTDGTTTVTDSTTFTLNDISFNTTNAAPFSSAENVSPGSTVAVSGITVAVAPSIYGSVPTISNPELSVVVSVYGDTGADQGALGITLVDTNSTITAGGASSGAAGVYSYTISGTAAQINADLGSLTFTDSAAGSNNMIIQASGGGQITNSNLVASFDTHTDTSTAVRIIPSQPTSTQGLYGTNADGFAGVSVTSVEVNGGGYQPVTPGTNIGGGFGSATYLQGNYVTFAVNADGSVQFTEADPQGIINEINAANLNNTDLTDTLNFQLSNGASVQETVVLNDISISTGTGPSYNFLAVPAYSTTPINNLGVYIEPSIYNGNPTFSNPEISVTLSLVSPVTDNEGGLGINLAAVGASGGTVTGLGATPGNGDSGQTGYIIQGTQAQVNADLANLYFNSSGAGNNLLNISVGNGMEQTASYGQLQLDVVNNNLGQIHDFNDFEVSPDLSGYGGSIDGTEANGSTGVTIVGISTDGVHFTDVPASGDVTINGTYQSFTADAQGDGSNNLLVSGQDVINAINQNNLTGSGPLTDSFYYEVQDASGNMAIDEFTDTYGDVGTTDPASFNSNLSVTSGGTLSLAGITIQKAASTDGNTIANNPSLAIGISAFDFSSQEASGTFSVDTSVAGGGGTVTIADGSIIISGSASQINADLTSLTYTGEDSGNYVLGVYTVDDSYVNAPGYQSATYDGPTIEVATCYAAGTRIMAEAGEIAVEDIKIGMRVKTLHAGLQPVIWTGARKVDLSTMADPESLRLVRIRRGAFATAIPKRDLLVTQEHCIFVDDKLIPARMLVNDRSIVIDRSIDVFSYHHVELAEHGILYAEGLTAESYLDTGNRSRFANSDVVTLHPAAGLNAAHKNWQTHAAAPLAVTRDVVEPVWQALNKRACETRNAATDAAIQLTTDADLHIVTASGQTIRPAANTGGRMLFVVPAGTAALRLMSRTFRPSETVGPFVDDRRNLGVEVGKITAWHGRQRQNLTQHLDAADLPGWFGRQANASRWTNGNALMHVPSCTTAILLDIEITSAGPYRMPAGVEDSPAKAAA